MILASQARKISQQRNPMLDRLQEDYSPNEKIPLGWYAATTVVFNGLLLASLRDARRIGERRSADALDILLAGIATHKLSRIITKDAVTSFLRAPFTRYQEPLGYGELSESPRRQGALLVVGEMLNCTY